nr:class I SAM-dependent methyltransferase [Listeria floridensis]
MSYEFFPTIYDELMDAELYDAWADFAKRHLPQDAVSLLDLASGTGEFAVRMALSGYQVSGLDLSSEMVRVAKEKFTAIELNVPIVEADMRSFHVTEPVDAVTCFCDSLNYLEEEDDVIATFSAVYEALKPGGYFLFDVHSVYKIEVGFRDYSYGDSDPYISTIWNSFPGAYPHSVEHELSFFVEQEDGSYQRKDELHKERTFAVEDYKKKNYWILDFVKLKFLLILVIQNLKIRVNESFSVRENSFWLFSFFCVEKGDCLFMANTVAKGGERVLKEFYRKYQKWLIGVLAGIIFLLGAILFIFFEDSEKEEPMLPKTVTEKPVKPNEESKNIPQTKILLT